MPVKMWPKRTHTLNWNTKPIWEIKEPQELHILIAKYSFPLPPCSVLSSHILYQTEILGAVALSFFSTATFLHIFSAGHKTRMNDSSWLQALVYPSAPPQKPAALLENIIPWTGNWQSVCASGCPSSVSLHCSDCRLFQKGHRWSPA